jgi:anti-sigma-K factor RskA
MRNELLGYLLGALENHERAQVENELTSDGQLRSEAELLRRSLMPLEADAERFDPPVGLARRTIDFVFLHLALQAQGPAANEPAVTRLQPNWSEGPVPARRWRIVDVSVAAGILVAALSVVVPAIIQSRANAERLACQNRMQQTYRGIAKYADMNNGNLPIATVSNDFRSKAGIYAPLLSEAGYLDDDEMVVCPGSQLASEVAQGDEYRIPTIAELENASGKELDRLLRRMGGSYAFAIGYRENGRYHVLRLRPGADFPLLADLPGKNGEPVGHHGGCGRNVLWANGAYRYIRTCCQPGTHDSIYTNDEGLLDAGMSRYDSVLGPSDGGPRVQP